MKRRKQKTVQEPVMLSAAQALKPENEDDVSWFVLRGFKKDNKDEVGFLSIGKTKGDIYNIVDTPEEAVKFPSKNVHGIQGFGTPQQWLSFFKKEPQLAEWKFHFVKVNGPKSFKK